MKQDDSIVFMTFIRDLLYEIYNHYKYNVSAYLTLTYNCDERKAANSFT